MVLKRFDGSNVFGNVDDTSRNPGAWNYWKREILAFESDILARLRGSFVAPRCYAITEHPNDEWRLWLEDIQEQPKTWSMARHGLATRHLGQFNGAFLAGRELPPVRPWFYSGHPRPGNWMEIIPPLFADFRRYAESEQGRLWLSQRSVDRMWNLFQNHKAMVALLDALPVTLCHRDAFRRNLLARDGANGEGQTVAIDWSMIGLGGLGEDSGITTAMGLFWFEVDTDRAAEMDQVTFESYMDGLHDTGWQGDTRLARYGYAVYGSLSIGVAMATYLGAVEFSTAEGVRRHEQNLGLDLNEILARWAVVHRFLLDLGDEALQLMEELW